MLCNTKNGKSNPPHNNNQASNSFVNTWCKYGSTCTRDFQILQYSEYVAHRYALYAEHQEPAVIFCNAHSRILSPASTIHSLTPCLRVESRTPNCVCHIALPIIKNVGTRLHLDYFEVDSFCRVALRVVLFVWCTVAFCNCTQGLHVYTQV